MYSAYQNLLDKLDGKDDQQIKVKSTDTRLLMAILFLTVIRADGLIRSQEVRLYNHLLDDFLNVTEDERHSFEQEVQKRFSSGEEVDQLITSLSELPKIVKHRMIDHMRDISLSDNEYHEGEIDLVSKAKALLGLDKH